MITTRRPIQPLKEIAAYEALWNDKKASYKYFSELFSQNPGARPSDFLESEIPEDFFEKIKTLVVHNSFGYKTNLLINGTFDFPVKLKDAKEPVEILYYTGNLDYLSTRAVSVVGTRNPTDAGLKRTNRLVKLLVADDFTIMSGLARGIDTAAHKMAISCEGRTIAVIGTPLDQVYPKENKDLQDYIARHHLLVSQVPFFRYRQQGIIGNRLFFPERNKTMSALSEATIIVEAGETSGTLVQARAALQQGRKLFILDSCFENKSITWPAKFLKLGAIRVKEYDDIRNVLVKK